MSAELMERERQLIEEVQRTIPAFARACAEANAEMVILSQDAFAVRLEAAELLLLGKAIKYAGMMGKEVRIVPAKQPTPS
jgi:hypothetical protein